MNNGSQRFSVLSYDMVITLSDPRFPLSATAGLELQNVSEEALSQVTLYLHPELRVERVLDMNGNTCRAEQILVDAAYSYTGTISRLKVVLADPVPSQGTTQIEVQYAGGFSPSFARGPSDYMRIDASGAFLRGAGYSYWFPAASCGPEGIDDAACFHICLNAPAKWKPLLFADLIQETTQDGRALSVWQTPEPWPLLFSHLAAADWIIVESEGVRVYCYSDSESRRAGEAYAGLISQLMPIFDQHFGEGLAQLPVLLGQMCEYGGIACGNVVGLPADRFVEVLHARHHEEILTLLAHELVHRYVIPMIDPSARGAALLLEAFPSYFHSIGLESVLGAGFRERFLLDAWDSYDAGYPSRDEASAPHDLRDMPLLDLTLDDIPRYKDTFLLSDKAILVLDQIRRLLGDAVFLGGVGEFLANHRRRPATFEAFVSALESRGATDLSGFVSRWINGTERLPDKWRPQAEPGGAS